MASTELRRRQQRHGQHLPITARLLADFLASLEADEVVLEQRLRDAEARGVLELLVGDPGIDASVVRALKPDDDAKTGIDTDGIPGFVGAAATSGDELVVYQDY